MSEAQAPRAHRRQRFFSKRFAVPTAHGSWAWWLGPLLIGMTAGGQPGWNFVSLALTALAGFLLLQPALIAVKVLAGRRPRTELRPALGWVAIYGFVALLGIACIAATGHARVLGLAAPALPLFVIYLWLVYRHTERRQVAVEMLAAGVLALAAPAAYWVAGGTDYPEPWALWAMTWLQSAAAIQNVMLRLDQRRWTTVPATGRRLQAGRRTIAYHLAGLLVAGAFVGANLAPPFVLVAFALVLLDAVDCVLRPRPGIRPVQVGVRQLLSTVLFVVLMVTAYVT